MAEQKKLTDSLRASKESFHEENLFDRCYAVDISPVVKSYSAGSRELSYISWADAWSLLKKNFPDAIYWIHFFDQTITHADGKVYAFKTPYLKTGHGAFVQVSVKIEGIEMTELLPVMDNKNESLEEPTSRDINDSIKRCLVKAIALHGLGIQLYESDDVYAKSENSTPYLNQGQGGVVQGEYRIDLGPNSPITGLTLDEAYLKANRNRSMSMLEESVRYWKPKNPKPQDKPGKFLKMAEVFLEAKKAIEPKNSLPELPPVEAYEDIPLVEWIL